MHAYAMAKDALIANETTKGAAETNCSKLFDEVKDLEKQLAALGECHKNLDQRLMITLSTRDAQVRLLQEVYMRANTVSQFLGLEAPDAGQSFREDNLGHLTTYFGHLVGQLEVLNAVMEKTMEEEGRCVAFDATMHILAGFYSRHPNFPIEDVFKEINPKKKEHFQATMLPYIKRLIEMLQRGACEKDPEENPYTQA